MLDLVTIHALGCRQRCQSLLVDGLLVGVQCVRVFVKEDDLEHFEELAASFTQRLCNEWVLLCQLWVKNGLQVDIFAHSLIQYLVQVANVTLRARNLPLALLGLLQGSTELFFLINKLFFANDLGKKAFELRLLGLLIAFVLNVVLRVEVI